MAKDPKKPKGPKKSAALAVIESTFVAPTSPKMGEVTVLSPAVPVVPSIAEDPLGAAAWFAVHAIKGEILATFLKVKCGVALLAAKQRLGVKQGSRADLSQDPRLADGWAGYLRNHCGLSEETARRWMDVAKKAKAKAAKLAGIDPVKMLHLEGTPEQWGLVLGALQKVCDGETMSSLGKDLGLITGPVGAHAKGGSNDGTSDTEKKLDPTCPPENWRHGEDVWAAYANGDDTQRTAMDHWLPIIEQAQEHGLASPNYAHLPEVCILRLRETLRSILAELPKGGK
jgi:hypothetical protein